MKITKFKEVELLPCELTEEEKYEYGLILAEDELEKDRLEDEIKELKEDFKSKIETKKEDIKRTATAIHTGQEEREVECEWLMHHPERNMKQLIRMDTGETVTTKEMSFMDKRRVADKNQLALVM